MIRIRTKEMAKKKTLLSSMDRRFFEELITAIAMHREKEAKKRKI